VSESRGNRLAFWRTPFFRAFLGSPSGILAIILFGGLIGTAVFAPLIFTEDEIYRRNIPRKLEGPSADFILGTDNLGRDIFKRTVYATRLSLELALSAAGMAIVLGFTGGAVVSYLPGRLRNVGVRLIEILLAFPGILIAVMLVAIFGASAGGAVLAIAIAFSPSLARVAYTLASSVAGLEYIASARVLGLSSRRIVFHYLIPNIAETLVVISFNAMASALVAVSSLSFLGLGVQGTAFDWGRLITEGIQRLYQVPFLALAPAIAIGTAGLAFGYMGEALARALNPLLWTKKAAEKQESWLKRYFTPDNILFFSAFWMLVAYYFLPWFNPAEDASNRALVTASALMSNSATPPEFVAISISGLSWFLIAAIAGIVLGVGSLFYPRWRRFFAGGGLLAGLASAGFFVLFAAQNLSDFSASAHTIQFGFVIGLIGVLGLSAQFFVKWPLTITDLQQKATLPVDAQPVEGPVKVVSKVRLLEVRGLTVQFATPSGIITPVNNLNFDLAEGEIVGVVGESGSGKSMMALAIAQLVPYPGQLTYEVLNFQNTDISQMPLGYLRRFLGTQLGLIFQDPMSSLNPALKIGTQLTEATRVHRGTSRKEAYKLALQRMDDVHIPAAEVRLKQYPHQFSGGMRQRAMIAMGLMTKPSLIIADEPTTALDVTIQAQILDVLQDINREYGTAIILISHDIGVIMQICTRVLVMYAGRIVEDLKVTELLSGHKHPYTEALIAAVPALDAARDKPLPSIPGRPPDLDRLPAGCAFAPRCPYVIDRCRSAVPPLTSLEDRHQMACFVRTEEIEMWQKSEP
jgi:oligopeptide/dipeptide ABC transporter ATP-binding protein